MRLSTEDHDRDAAGMTYVYPVVSRRSRGLSIGVNLNPGKACNWRCVYCQVPGLQRGAPPAANLEQLEQELTWLLDQVVNGDFFERQVPEDSRRLNDVAFSGDGESTLCPNFEQAVELVGQILARFDLAGNIPLVLITNGSRVRDESVGRGLSRIAKLGGEAWFKIDRATPEARRKVNDTRGEDEAVLERLSVAATLCPVRIQTCVFAFDGDPPTELDQTEYLALLARALEGGVAIRDVLLYGLARPSMQAEAPRLERLPVRWLEAFSTRIRALGLEVQVHE
ncbi:MAG: radical SAM protein [Proteobacteria bacterium]|nr:radical SAM protein [Pseudomonadota bacterium]